MKKSKSNLRTPLVWNWRDSSVSRPMRSLKIHFSHPVKIYYIYRNDDRVRIPHEGKTYLPFNPTYNGSWVTIQFRVDEVQVGAKPPKGIFIELKSKNKYVKINEFIWYVNRNASGTKKKAKFGMLKKFNKDFLKPPRIPKIIYPRDGAISYNKNPNIIGNAEKKSTVAVFVNGEKKGNTRASTESGRWKYKISTSLRIGKHKFTAKLINFEGNDSEESKPTHYTVRK